jgi:hypothetical protein
LFYTRLWKKIPVGDGDDLRPQLLGHFICLFTLIINIYGLGEGISTIVNFLMVEIPTPKPYIFMIRVTRQIKYLIAQAPGVIPHPYLR